MNVRIFWVRAMECLCAQNRPRFILSPERGFREWSKNPFFFFFSFVRWKLKSPRWRWQCIAGPSGFRWACGLRGCGLARFPFWVARRWGRPAVDVLLSDCQYRKGTAPYGQYGVSNTGDRWGGCGLSWAWTLSLVPVPREKNPLYRRLRGGSNPRGCITQDSEPNTLPTELFRPPENSSKRGEATAKISVCPFQCFYCFYDYHHHHCY